MEDENFEVRSGRASGKREKKKKVDSSSHSESEHEKETYMVGMKIQGLKEGAGCGALSEKHTVAGRIKNESGEVKLIDIKRSGLIGVKCKTLMEKALKILVLGSGLDMYPVACFPLSKTAPIKGVVD